MDSHGSKAEGSTPVSVLEGEGSYFHRIISREPSLGHSSRHYAYQNPGRIPFRWEKQPGQCKFDPPEKGHSNPPRIRPPPILASKIMKLPSWPDHGGGPKEPPASSWSSKMKFWRKIKSKKTQLMMPRCKDQARGSDPVSKGSLNGSSFTSSDDNRMSSSSSSSSSKSSSSSNSTSSLCIAAPLQSSNSAKGHNHRSF
ncbi:hypothetical protein BT93_A1049 [Corymbia citriodora subsp. variegata]|nr:hypothetical protein BT93_A1049 [Corymbia citriodora subsp. variegata]